MGLFDGLKKFNNAVNSVEDKKERLKDLTDDSRRTDEDRACIKKAKRKLWGMMFFALVAGVATFFLIKLIMTLSILSLAGVFGILVLGAVYSMMLKRTIAYVNDEGESLGNLIMCKVLIGFTAIMLALALILAIIVPFSLNV